MICPRCGSRDVRVTKFGFAEFTLHERSCNQCALFESRRSDEPDFDAWHARWSTRATTRRPAARRSQAPREPLRPVQSPVIPDAADDAWQDLYAAICRDVTDDAPRLAYADAIADTQPERAEFIRLQVARFVVERASGVRRSARSQREAELHEAFGATWARVVQPFADAGPQAWAFERGFVAQLRADPRVVADPGERVFASAPLEHLDLCPGPVVAALRSPRLAQLRSLGLRSLDLDDEAMLVLAREARLDRCEWLDLRSNAIGERGVRALAESPRIRAIPVVLLAFNPCDPAMQFTEGDEWLPPEGEALERAHGRIPWLHLPPVLGLPDRHHATSATYVDEA